jgi:hypothetical protein
MATSTLERLRNKKRELKEKETRLFERTSRGGFTRITDFEEGKTTIRIVKNEKDDIPFAPMKSTWFEVEVGIDGLYGNQLIEIIKDKKLEKAIGIKDVKELEDSKDDEIRELLKDELGADFTKKVNKKIFNSKIHGNSEILDVIEEYIKFADKFFKENLDPDTAKKKKALITGYRDSGKKWHSGIMPNSGWICYIFNWDGEKKFSRFEMWDKHMIQIEELYVAFDGEDEPLAIDPFSDEVEGVALIVERSKDEKGKDQYKISDVRQRTGSREKFLKQFALTPDQISEVNEKEPLKAIYENVYSRKDFELALNGLDLFDEKHDLGIFENDDFIDIIKPIIEYYENLTEEVKHAKDTSDIDGAFEKADKNKKDKKIEEAEIVEEKDDMAILDEKPEKVKEKEASKYGSTRGELKVYIMENELDVHVLKKHSEDQIIEMIKQAELLEEGDVNENSFSADEEPDSRAAEMKEKLRNKNKK